MLPIFIAKRYLIAKKATNFINIISSVSFLGIAIATAALVIILSVFNGLENLVSSLFTKFDPALKIEVVQGKVFAPTAPQMAQLQSLPEIATIAQTLQESALFKYQKNQTIATIKGIDQNFVQLTHIDSCLSQGDFALQTPDGVPLAVVGSSLAYTLAIAPNDYTHVLEIFVPNRSKTIDFTNPNSAFNSAFVQPVGFFNVQPEINAKYVLVSLAYVQNLLGYQNNQISALEIGAKPGVNVERLATKIKAIFGEKFTIKNRYQQQEAVYKIFKIEKWAAFLILSFIVFISALNLVGLLTMLVLDKKADIALLQALGANKSLITRIFLTQGILITLTGAFLGIFLGVAACLLQQKFGFIAFEGSGNFIIDYYPVSVQATDILSIFVMVLSLGFLCAIYPAWQAANAHSSTILVA